MFGRPKQPPSIKSTRLSSLIAAGVEICGDVTFSNGMRIDGTVKGNVVGLKGEKAPALLVLSEKAHVVGNVRCGDAVINGAVTGDLDVEHFLELQSNARVCGTIRYRQLRMDIGAEVQGQLLMVDGRAPDNVVELGAEKIAAAGAERR